MNNTGKKTVIVIAPTPPPFMGPSVAVQALLNSRFTDEFNVVLIDTADRRPIENMEKIDFGNVYLALKHYSQLFIKLISARADIVYFLICQTTIGYLRDVPFILISKLFGKKVVIHLHGAHFRNFYNASNSIMKFIIRNTLKLVDQVILLGDSLKYLFEGLVPEEKLAVVPNGINLEFGDREYSDDKSFQVLFLSNLIETKGFKDVLFSVKKTVETASVEYTFAGAWFNPDDRRECQDYAEREGISGFVRFTGYVEKDAKAALLEKADVLVLPTCLDGQPLVILEAMAAGLPIISTDTGCIKDMVIDGDNGFIIPAKSPEAISEKVLYLAGNVNERERMGRRSREMYELRYTEDKYVDNMVRALHGL